MSWGLPVVLVDAVGRAIAAYTLDTLWSLPAAFLVNIEPIDQIDWSTSDVGPATYEFTTATGSTGMSTRSLGWGTKRSGGGVSLHGGWRKRWLFRSCLSRGTPRRRTI